MDPAWSVARFVHGYKLQHLVSATADAEFLLEWDPAGYVLVRSWGEAAEAISAILGRFTEKGHYGHWEPEVEASSCLTERTLGCELQPCSPLSRSQPLPTAPSLSLFSLS